MKIHIGEGLTLPANFARERLAVLGQSGAGKTNLLYLMFEQFVRAGVQTVLLDPPGVGWGLAFDKHGKPNDLSVVIVGGGHGELPLSGLSTTGARELADVVIDRGLSVVVDLSGLEDDAVMHLWVRDFVRQIHRRKMATPGLLHVMFDEAQELAPSQPQTPEHHAVRRTVERFCKQVRNYGVGWTLASQQPQALDSRVRGQCTAVFALHTAGGLDQEAVIKTINRRKSAVTADALEALPTGTAMVYCPRELGASVRTVAIDYRSTFDVPKANENQTALPKAQQRLSPADLVALRTAYSAAVSEAERNDPVALRSKLEDAERRATIAEAKAEHAAQAPAILASRIAAANHAADETLGALRKAMEESTMKTFQSMLSKSKTSNLHDQPSPERDPRWSAVTGLRTPVRVVRTDDLAGKVMYGAAVPKRMVDICEVLAEHPAHRLHESKVAMLIGMQAKGGGYIGLVKAAVACGYISRHDRILRLEPPGVGLGGGGVPRGLDNRSVIDRHRGRLPAKAVAMLEAVERATQSKLPIVDLAVQVGMVAAGGGFAGYLSQLRARGLVVTRGGWAMLGEAFAGGVS